MNDYLKQINNFNSFFPKPNLRYNKERTSDHGKWIHSTKTQIKLSMKIKTKMTRKCLPNVNKNDFQINKQSKKMLNDPKLHSNENNFNQRRTQIHNQRLYPC
jgi:hypothetical protein